MEEVIQLYPALQAVSQTDEAFKRIWNQYTVDAFIADPQEFPVGTYGESAQTYRDAIETILRDNPEDLKNPRILILGALTPGSVRQVINFTEKFHPKNITLADQAPESIALAKAYGLQIEGCICDFLNPEETEKIPDYDIAIGDRVMSYCLDGSKSREENVHTAEQFIESVGHKLAPGGGIVLVDYGRDFDTTNLVFDSTEKINQMILESGLKIVQVAKAKTCMSTRLPSYDDLLSETYPPGSYKEDESYLKYMTIVRTFPQNLSHPVTAI